MGRLAYFAISLLFVDCSLQFYHLEFDKEAISDGCMHEELKMLGIGGVGF